MTEVGAKRTRFTFEQWKGYRVYHPFFSFSGPAKEGFFDSNNSLVYELDADTTQLYRLGRKAFRSLEGAISDAKQFDRVMSKYSLLTKAWRTIIAKAAGAGILEVKFSSEGVEISQSLAQIPQHITADVAWSLLKDIPKGDAKSYCESMLYMTYVMQTFIDIDYALLHLRERIPGVVAAALRARQSLENALVVKSGSDALIDARSKLAYEAAIERIRRDPKQKEKSFIRQCWHEWRASPSKYSSKAAFARDMLTKCDHLTSQKKIEDWCREWESEDPLPAS